MNPIKHFIKRDIGKNYTKTPYARKTIAPGQAKSLFKTGGTTIGDSCKYCGNHTQDLENGYCSDECARRDK